MSLHIETPLIESVPLSLASGREVYLKLENTQPSSSFKIRGIGKLIENLYAESKRVFICPSSGNAGYSVAWVARKLGAHAVIVAPESTPQAAIDAIKMLGGEVIVHGNVWDLSNEYAMILGTAAPENAYITSYDDPILWDGHATMVDEIKKQLPFKPDAILCSVGGGGLISGLAEGLIRNDWEDVKLIGCGTYGANAYSETIRTAKPIDIGVVSSGVHCIAATHVTTHILELINKINFLSNTCSDYSAAKSCEKFIRDHRFVVDPACGVTLSAVYEPSDVLDGLNRIVIIVCGGAGVTIEEIQELKGATQ